MTGRGIHSDWRRRHWCWLIVEGIPIVMESDIPNCCSTTFNYDMMEEYSTPRPTLLTYMWRRDWWYLFQWWRRLTDHYSILIESQWCHFPKAGVAALTSIDDRPSIRRYWLFDSSILIRYDDDGDIPVFGINAAIVPCCPYHSFREGWYDWWLFSRLAVFVIDDQPKWFGKYCVGYSVFWRINRWYSVTDIVHWLIFDDVNLGKKWWPAVWCGVDWYSWRCDHSYSDGIWPVDLLFIDLIDHQYSGRFVTGRAIPDYSASVYRCQLPIQASTFDVRRRLIRLIVLTYTLTIGGWLLTIDGEDDHSPCHCSPLLLLRLTGDDLLTWGEFLCWPYRPDDLTGIVRAEGVIPHSAGSFPHSTDDVFDRFIDDDHEDDVIVIYWRWSDDTVFGADDIIILTRSWRTLRLFVAPTPRLAPTISGYDSRYSMTDVDDSTMMILLWWYIVVRYRFIGGVTGIVTDSDLVTMEVRCDGILTSVLTEKALTWYSPEEEREGDWWPFLMVFIQIFCSLLFGEIMLTKVKPDYDCCVIRFIYSSLPLKLVCWYWPYHWLLIIVLVLSVLLLFDSDEAFQYWWFCPVTDILSDDGHWWYSVFRKEVFEGGVIFSDPMCC